MSSPRPKLNGRVRDLAYYVGTDLEALEKAAGVVE